jgi:preprotein translocase subunit SecG
MSTLETVLLGLLVADALALAVLVLIQHGKGADIGAAFGSGGANTVFGSGGSGSFLTKVTVWLAIGFFVISFGLAYTAKERAAALDTLGIPQVPVAPVDGQGRDGRLTTEPERVDSDIPDV